MEAPHLQKLHQEVRNRGGVVIGLALDGDSVASLKQFQRRNKTSYPIAIDQGGKNFDRFDLGIPSTVLRDRNGVIRLVHEGYEPASFAATKRRFIALLPPKRR